MRRTAINKTDWVDIKLKGGVLKHPEQKDTNSCDVIVILVKQQRHEFQIIVVLMVHYKIESAIEKEYD